MNNKILKITKYLLITVICISILLMIIVSQDEHHLGTCHEEHCAKCQIIQMARNIIKTIQAVILCVFIGFFICVVLDKINKEKIISLPKTLIFDKVQLNE
ncbi:MAG: hypothetical protein J6N78_04670 [Clostridia bacterium]|nr:hypothetical protein [Clostridia bacterium]